MDARAGIDQTAKAGISLEPVMTARAQRVERLVWPLVETLEVRTVGHWRCGGQRGAEESDTGRCVG